VSLVRRGENGSFGVLSAGRRQDCALPTPRYDEPDRGKYIEREIIPAGAGVQPHLSVELLATNGELTRHLFLTQDSNDHVRAPCSPGLRLIN
jgi:hypothetical protein